LEHDRKTLVIKTEVGKMVVCISLLKPRAFKLPSARGASGLNI
jgi:hypothetical protein